MVHVVRVPIVAALSLVLLAAAAGAQPWPQFRGARGGLADDHPSLPDTWSQNEHVAWKLTIPGRGWSSPIVHGDHVFVTSALNATQTEKQLLPPEAYRGRSVGGTMSRTDTVRDSDEFRWVLYDVDRNSGRVRWERVLYTGVPTRPVHMKNSYATETPVTDGQRVYVYLAYVGLFAYDMAGNRIWARPMEAKNTGTGDYFYGGASSPALHDGRVFIVNDNEEGSFAAAFDAATGRELWRVARDEPSNWSTPYVWTHRGRTEIVTVGGRKVRSYSVDGKLLWALAVGTTLHAPTPFAHGDVLYVNSGYYSDSKRPLMAIRAGASGDISLIGDETSNDFVIWMQPRASATYPSGIVVGAQYYMLLDRGILVSYDAATGKQIYQQRLATDAGTFSASPWSYNGKLFMLSEDGETFVVQTGPEFKVLARNKLDELSLATPAVSGDSVFIRTASKLYRLTGVTR